MKTPFCKRSAFLTSLLLGIGGLSLACFLWVKSEQQQYALNRQLIQALGDHDYKQAIALVNSGADPNTPLFSLPVPSFPELVRRLYHREPLGKDSETAFLFAFGMGRVVEAADCQDFIKLAGVMIAHGANVNATNERTGQTCLMSAIDFGRIDLMTLLLQHGANIWKKDCYGNTALRHAEIFDMPKAGEILAKYYANAKPTITDVKKPAFHQGNNASFRNGP